MSVHYLALHSPTGSPIRSLLDADGSIVPWPAPSTTATRPLRMALTDRTAPGAHSGADVLVDSDGRHWIHPAHLPVVLRNERPSTQVAWLPRGDRAQA